MPTYQYACTECAHTFEEFQSFSDDALSECPRCHGRLRKLFNAVGVVFKGSGFYRNDSRGTTSSSESGSGSTKEPAASSTDSGSTSDATSGSGSGSGSGSDSKSGSGSSKKSESAPKRSDSSTSSTPAAS